MKKVKRVAVGLSGGVDSAVAAALLKKQGYDVTGVFLECWRAPGCRTDEDRKDALAVALKLKIPFKVLDFKKEYKAKVVDYFYEEYKAGRTPNPDTMCNREIKFGLFYEWALRQAQGKLSRFDYVATGHYARIRRIRELPISKFQFPKKCRNSLLLLRGVDEKKDQSYFLYQLREEQLKHILFPVGGMTKEGVRKEAKRQKLPVADKPDSQGICFIGEVKVEDFLKDLGMKEIVGQVVDAGGKVIGKHKGAWFYTIGQRHGFKINSKVKGQKSKLDLTKLPPLYVVSKDVKNNRLVIGTRKKVMRREFEVAEVHWVTSLSEVDTQLSWVRIRHGGALVRAKLIANNEKLKVKLVKPIFGVAAGQAAVFYNNEVCLGGGVIIN